MLTSAATTAPISPACLECGTIKKSGKISCCGHGGSWYGNCGSVDNTNLGHTWQKGILVCKTRQSQTVKGHQLHASKPEPNDFSDDDSMDIDDMAVVITTYTPGFAPANTSTLLTGITPMAMPRSTLIITSDRTSVAHAISTTTYKLILPTTYYNINNNNNYYYHYHYLLLPNTTYYDLQLPTTYHLLYNT